MTNKPKNSSSSKNAKAKISFASEALLQQAMAGLLSRLPEISNVQILQGPHELGHDIVFNMQGGLGETLLCACLIKNMKITGGLSKRGRARSVSLQAEQALGSTYTNGLGEEAKIERLYIVTPYSLAPSTVASIKSGLKERAGQVQFIGGAELLNMFQKHWPQYFANESEAIDDDLRQSSRLQSRTLFSHDESDNTNVVDRLRRALSERAMTSMELSAKAGISPSSLSRILSGSVRPKPDTLARLGLILNVDFHAKHLSEDNKDFGGRVMRARVMEGLARVEVARMAGISDKTLSRIERGTVQAP